MYIRLTGTVCCYQIFHSTNLSLYLFQHLPAWPHGIAVWLPSDHSGWVRVDGSCHSWHGRVVVGRVHSGLTEYHIRRYALFHIKFTCNSVMHNEVGSHFLYEYILGAHFILVFPSCLITHLISTKNGTSSQRRHQALPYVRAVIQPSQNKQMQSIINISLHFLRNLPTKKNMCGEKSVHHLFLKAVVICLIPNFTWAINNPSRGCGKEMPESLNPGQTIQFNVTYNDRYLGAIPRLYHMQIPRGTNLPSSKLSLKVTLNVLLIPFLTAQVFSDWITFFQTILHKTTYQCR